jgi:putative ubiquitin-RnfH superfamily antitoxin RatB of RatAB toxin-antitoxin module
MTEDKLISVQVAFATPQTQLVFDLALNAGASIAEAILTSGICARFPELDLETLQAGVWGKIRSRSYPLREGDRVEIYRVLKADPKDARRSRASTEKKHRQ